MSGGGLCRLSWQCSRVSSEIPPRFGETMSTSPAQTRPRALGGGVGWASARPQVFGSWCGQSHLLATHCATPLRPSPW